MDIIYWTGYSAVETRLYRILVLSEEFGVFILEERPQASKKKLQGYIYILYI